MFLAGASSLSVASVYQWNSSVNVFPYILAYVSPSLPNSSVLLISSSFHYYYYKSIILIYICFKIAGGGTTKYLWLLVGYILLFHLLTAINKKIWNGQSPPHIMGRSFLGFPGEMVHYGLYGFVEFLSLSEPKQ